MADQIYKVRDPSGNIREIRGPAGATDDQVIEQAKVLFGAAQDSAQTPAAPAPAPTAQEQPSIMSRLGDAAIQGMRTMGPMGAVAGLVSPGIDEANKLLQQGAYKSGESVTDLTGSPELGFAANVGVQALPTLAGGAAGKLVGKAGKGIGEFLMRSALKPSTAMPTKDAARAVKTMLTADVGNVFPGANVTSGGIGQIQEKIGTLGNKVDSILSATPGTVNKYQVGRDALADTLKKFGPARNPTPSADLSAISSDLKDYLLTHPARMTASEAQNLKKGAYQLLGDKAYSGELKSSQTEMGKALARGLRNQLESLAPGIAPLNAEQGELLNALSAAISRNAVAANKNPAGLAFLANNPMAAAAYMADRSELIKSLLGRLLYSTAEPVGTGLGASGGAWLQYSNDSNKQGQ